MKSMNHTTAHLGAHQMGHALKGHPGMLLAIGGLWLVGKALNIASKPWKCESCNHDFS